jgi:hypothetical protein
MDLHQRLPIVLAVALPFALGVPTHRSRPAPVSRVDDDSLVAWHVTGRASSARTMRDTTQKHGGSASGRVIVAAPTPDLVNSGGRGGGGQRGPRVRPVRFEQTVNAIPYRERRLRVSLWVRTKLPDKPAKDMPMPQAFTFVSADNEDGTITAYEAIASPFYGTTEWTRKVMIIEVPPDAFALSFGVSVMGPGEVWLDDAVLEDQGAASGSYTKQPMFTPEQVQRATPEQVEQGKAMLARRAAAMKERPAEVTNGDFETR